MLFSLLLLQLLRVSAATAAARGDGAVGASVTCPLTIASARQGGDLETSVSPYLLLREGG